MIRRFGPPGWWLSVLLLLGCQPQSPAERLLTDAAALKRGQQLFTGVCSGYCHGRRSGVSDAPNLMNCTWLHGGADEEVFRTIAGGVSGTRMRGFAGKLPEGENDIWRIVAYLRSKRQC